MPIDTSNERHAQQNLPGIDLEFGSSDHSFTYNGNNYTREYCVNDLRNTAEDFPQRRITRDFYRRNANVPERVWIHFFGTFQEFIRQAGLNYTRYENRIRNNIARNAANDPIRDISEERKNYGGLYLRENNRRFKTAVIASDLHDIECDPFFLRVFVDTVQRIQPEVIVLGGDVFDFPEFGRYEVDPREWDVVGRIRAGHQICSSLRYAAPESQIDLIEGNHEARMLKHLSNVSPSMRAVLSDLHEMDTRKLLKLDDYEVNYVAQADLQTFTDSQLKREISKNYRIYCNSFLGHHFPEARSLGLPGVNGHHHKHVVWSEYNVNIGSYEWHQLGAGHVRQAPYCDGAKWQNGFIIANVDTHNRYTNFDYVDVGATFAVSGGQFYYREEAEIIKSITDEIAIKNSVNTTTDIITQI